MVVFYWLMRHLVLVLVLSAALYGWIARDNLDGWLGIDHGHEATDHQDAAAHQAEAGH